MPRADCGSGDIPMVGPIKIKQNKGLKRTITAPKLELDLLESDKMMNKYSISVKNKFSALGQLTTAEERWQMFKERMLESAREHIPVTKQKKDNPEILDLIEERRIAKANIQKYRELDKQVKKRCNEAKKHWINTQCEEIEANDGVNCKTVHQKTKEVTGKKTKSKNRVHTIKRWRHCDGRGGRPQQVVRIHYRAVP